ncbi:MAG: tetratricopeptide repeat protein [Vicinamibacterales bacterium]
MRLPLTLAALALVPLALYARVTTFDFVQADDTDLIRGNMSFLQNLRNVPEAFQRSYFNVEGQPSGRKTYYRPLVIVSFMVDAQAGGAEPRVYHVTNVLIHTVGVLLLFALLKTLGSEDTPALALSLLFASHPANVQAIAWIPGRNDTLMAALALVSLIAFLHYRRTTSAWWLALHVAAYAGALFTKESALALPVLLALLAVASQRDPSDGRRLGPAVLADGAVVAGWFLLRRAALVDGGDGPGAWTLLTALAANAWDLLLYAGKIVLPAHLSVMPGLTRLDMALGGASLALLVWLLARLAPRWRRVVIGWVLLFLIPALLVSGLPAYEHRLYFPLMGVIVGISQLPVWSAASRRAAVATVATVAAGFAALSVAHTGVFRDRYAYWSSATKGTPYAGLAHVNLGQISESDGDTARAAEHYRAALAADPATPGAHNNLGVLAARRGDADEARAEFRREVARHPANADAYFNLGLVEKLSNRIDAAAPWWERAVAADPGHAAAHQELAAYYAAKGDAARAARHRDAVRALTGTR